MIITSLDKKIFTILGISFILFLSIVLFADSIGRFVGDIGSGLKNPSFEDTTDQANWILAGTNADPVIKKAYSTAWRSHGNSSMRVYGSLAVERDGYIDLMQTFDLPTDAKNISADLNIAVGLGVGVGYRMFLCTLAGECIDYPKGTVPLYQEGTYKLTISGIPANYLGNTVVLKLRTSFRANDVIDGYWDNVRIDE